MTVTRNSIANVTKSQNEGLTRRSALSVVLQHLYSLHLSTGRPSTTVVTKNLHDTADDILEWYIQWKIAIKADRKGRFPPEIKITVFDKQVPWRRVKYLEVTIDERVNFTVHVHKSLKKFRGVQT